MRQKPVSFYPLSVKSVGSLLGLIDTTALPHCAKAVHRHVLYIRAVYKTYLKLRIFTTEILRSTDHINKKYTIYQRALEVNS
jgi:hypothetical protein